MFDRSSSSRRGNTSDKAVFSSFLFLLAGEGRRGGEDGMGRRGEGGQERVMKSFQQGTFCSSFFFHSNYVMSRLLVRT